jgi:methyl-accepting chemotaxis protein
MPSFRGKLNRSSIFFKAMAMIAAVIITVAGSVSYMNDQAMLARVKELVVERGISAAELLRSGIYGPTRFGDAEKAGAALTQMLVASNGQGLAGVVLKSDGSLLVSQAMTGGAPEALAASATAHLAEAMKGRVREGDFIFVPILQDGTADDAQAIGVLGVQWSAVGVSDAIRSDMIYSLSAAGLLALAAIAVSMWLTSRGLIKPIVSLRGAIQTIGAGAFDVVVPGTKRRDELGSISASVEDLRAALQSSEGLRIDAAYKSAAFTAASAALMLADKDFKIRYVNPAMMNLLETYREFIPRLKNKTDMDNITSLGMDDFHTNGDQIRRRLANIGTESFRTIVAFGDARVSLSISAVTDQSGAFIGVIMDWSDITQEWLNKAILDAIDADQLRADFDIEGHLLWANAPFCKALGGALAELKGKSLRLLSGAAGSQAENILRAALEPAAYKDLITLHSQSGAAVIVDGSMSCVRDTSNRPIRLMLLGRDVTRQETDIREARAGREASEAAQNEVVEALRIGLRQLSNGDLTAVIRKPFAGSYEDLRVDYNQTVETLGSAMREIAENAENINNQTGDISKTADGLSRRTENTAATLEQTAAALDELTSSVKVAATGAAEADKAVREAKQNAEQSGVVVLETVSAMDQISQSSDKITSIIKVIDDIAFQTNLLALNAGVEAARAGDAGRGFAVVASEVRALAQRSSDAAREINELIAKSGSQVKKGVDLVGRTGSALQSIVSSVSTISDLVSRIAESSQQQSLSLAEINQSVNQLDQSTQQNAARLEETTAASESLRKDAVSLVETVSHFKLVAEDDEQEAVVPFRTKPRSQTARPVVAKVARSASATQASAAVAQSAQGWEDF